MQLADGRCLSDVAVSAQLSKGFHLYFHLYKKRNEWVDWDGFNMRVKRSEALLPSLGQAELAAEESPIQGSSFFIEEFPYIAIRSKSAVLVVSEVYTDKPLQRAPQTTPTIAGGTLQDFARVVSECEHKVRLLWPGSVKTEPAEEPYYQRSSSPGKGANSLGWKLNARSLDTSFIEAVLVRIQARIANSYHLST